MYNAHSLSHQFSYLPRAPYPCRLITPVNATYCGTEILHSFPQRLGIGTHMNCTTDFCAHSFRKLCLCTSPVFSLGTARSRTSTFLCSFFVVILFFVNRSSCYLHPLLILLFQICVHRDAKCLCSDYPSSSARKSIESTERDLVYDSRCPPTHAE